MTNAGCQTNALVGYFGECREAPCGHCSCCLTGSAAALPQVRQPDPLPAGLDVAGVQALRQAHPEALGAPRQVARFLCGLTSPALVHARLTRDALFGRLADRRFGDVLAWVEGQ